MDEDRVQRSPSLQRLLQRRPSFSRPPIRSIRSPMLTDEEAEMLTSPYLKYRTRYTYAQSRCYNPDYPDDWEVPNLANPILEIQSPLKYEEEETAVHYYTVGYLTVLVLYIQWIFELLTYFVKKALKNFFIGIPKSVAVLVYDFINWIYYSVTSPFRSKSITSPVRSSSAQASFLARTKNSTAELTSVIYRRTYSVLSTFFLFWWWLLLVVITITKRGLELAFTAATSLFSIALSPVNFAVDHLKALAKRLSHSPRRVSYNDNNFVKHFDARESPSTVSEQNEMQTRASNSRSGTPQRESYALRNRQVIQNFEDTEDEGYYEDRPARVSLGSTPHRKVQLRKKALKHNLTKSQKIAEWLAHVTSIVFAIFAWMLFPLDWLLGKVIDCGNFIFYESKSAIGHLRTAIFGEPAIMHSRKTKETIRRSMRTRYAVPGDLTEDDEDEDYEESRQINNHQQATHNSSFVTKVVTYPVELLKFFFYGVSAILLTVTFGIVDACRAFRNGSVEFLRALKSMIFGVPEQVTIDGSAEEFVEVHQTDAGWSVQRKRSLTPLVAFFSSGFEQLATFIFSFFYWPLYYIFSAVKHFCISTIPSCFKKIKNGFVNMYHSTKAASKKAGKLYWLLWLIPLVLLLLFLFSGQKEAVKVREEVKVYGDHVAEFASKSYKSLPSLPSLPSMPSLPELPSLPTITFPTETIKKYYRGVINFGAGIPVYFTGLWAKKKQNKVDILIEQPGEPTHSIYQDYLEQGQYAVFSTYDRVKFGISHAASTVWNFINSVFTGILKLAITVFEWFMTMLAYAVKGVRTYWAAFLIWWSSFAEKTAPVVVVVPPTPVYIPAPAPAPVPVPVESPPTPQQAPPPVIIQPPAVICPTVDQEKLVEEVNAKVQLDMEAKLKTFDESYAKVIKELRERKTSVEVDYTQLEMLIRQAIYHYDADKTGLFDYALESAGAAIISTRCSESYNSYSRLERIWGIPLWYSTYGPRTVIQRNAITLFPGECWSFKSGRGYLTIELSHPINISSISYEHIGKEQAPDGSRNSAPRQVKFWAYQTENDFATRFLLGSYEYQLDEHPLQFFMVKTQPNYPVKIVEMEVESNYGSEFTCLYRLRVHGQVYKTNN